MNDADELFTRLSILINDANEKQTTTLKLEIQSEIIGVKTKIAELEKIIEQKQEKVNRLENNQIELQAKYKTLEKSLKRNNVLIFGLTYDNKKGSLAEYIILKVNQLLQLELTVNCLNNVYLVGRSGDNRPVLVQFQSFLTKSQVLKECRKLKGTGISISEDLTKEEREKQKILFKHKKLALSKGYKAYVKNNKLYVNNEEYSIQDLQENDNEEQLRTPQKLNSPKHRTISSAPATPTIQYREESEEDSDKEEEINIINKENLKKKEVISSDTINEKVVTGNKEELTDRKRKILTSYSEGNKKKKDPVSLKNVTETKKIITRSVNK